MSETKPSMPAQPKTVELPAQTDRALLEDLTRVVKSGFASLSADISLVSTDVQVVKDRVVILEKWKIESEERATKNSIRARATSESDMRQDAELAQEREAREALAKEVAAIKTETAAQTKMIQANNAWTKEILDAGKGFVKEHPQLVTGLVGLISAAISFATAWFSKGH